MTHDQIALFILLAVVFALLIWGRWRYDLVAFAALMAALALGLVPADDAFSGFGHPATVIIALVLVVSRGLSNSGVIEFVAARIVDSARRLSAHIAIMAGTVAGLSAVMNNVAALALLMPVDVQAAKKAKRSPALSLMPLSFASILGGMVTLIGTPPNIIVAGFRERALGEPFSMFDFTPVGAACAIAGIAFIALIGWRLIPAARPGGSVAGDPFDLEGYLAELRAKKDGKAVGQRVRDLDELAREHDVQILGLVRRGKRLPGLARRETIRAGDRLVVEAAPEPLETFAAALGLSAASRDDAKPLLSGDNLAMREAVVQPGSLAEGRQVGGLTMLRRRGVTLVGVSRSGRTLRDRLPHLRLAAGDVLLLLGAPDDIADAASRIGALPLAERGLQLPDRRKAGLAVGLFAAAIAAAGTGLVYLPVALGCVVALYVLLGVVPLRELYGSVEWSVIVLLGAMIPIGSALETTGGTILIADGLLALADGYQPAVALALLMIVTMTLSDVMNNTATAVIAAPVAIEVAAGLGVNPDPFLMAVAVAASCAFLTPIGHKNNTLILGPGGYRFGDYWRMGLPLEILVVAVGVPAILIVWPF